MEYSLIFYDTMRQFNELQYQHTERGWTVKDFRLIPSQVAINGVAVMWEKRAS